MAKFAAGARVSCDGVLPPLNKKGLTGIVLTVHDVMGESLAAGFGADPYCTVQWNDGTTSDVSENNLSAI